MATFGKAIRATATSASFRRRRNRTEHFKNNAKFDYRFVQHGCGVRGSEANLEIRWFTNRDFRLALLRKWKEGSPEQVIDFTRYDLPAKEPADPEPGKQSRNWSLINRINQKGIRPQNKPVPIGQLTGEEQEMIKRHYPDLFDSGSAEKMIRQ